MEKNKLGKHSNNQDQNEQLSFFDELEQSDETDSIESTAPSKERMSDYQIVDDFIRFVNCLLEQNVYLTKTREYISRKFLPNINCQLSVQNDAATINSEQHYYPYIHLLFHLAIASKIFKKVSGQAGNKSLQVTERLNLFHELTDTEKYYFLLETFWIDVDWDDLQDQAYQSVAQTLQELFIVLTKDHPVYANLLQEVDYTDDVLGSELFDWHYFLLFFEWFGLWVTEPDHQAIKSDGIKKSYYAKTLTITEFGEQVIPILLFERNLQFWNITLRWKYGEVNALPGSIPEHFIFLLPEDVESNFPKFTEGKSPELFLQSFKKCYPNKALQKSLPRRLSRFVNGQYIFKVFLTDGVWRSVVLSGQHTMEDLHEIIIHAYDFSDDHLYSFFLDGKRWSEFQVVSPLEHFGYITADKVKIGELGLDVGQSFMYLFDYGAEWTFTVVLEHLHEQVTTIMRPFIKESRGSGPHQY